MSKVILILLNLLYHQFSWMYDSVSKLVSAGKWNSWVVSIEKEITGPCVLELGHGPGHLQSTLIDNGLNIFGLDSSIYMSRLAKRNIKNSCKQPSLVNGIAQQLPFKNHTFHQVVATFPTSYIFDLKTLNEVHRVLFPKGNLIILPQATITSPSGVVEKISSWLFKQTNQVLTDESEFFDTVETPMTEAGFVVSIHRRSHYSSTIWLVIARKQQDHKLDSP